MKPVKININNKQKFPDGENDEITTQSIGRYKYKNGKHYLIYKETNEGFDNAKTILRINKKSNRVLLKRNYPHKLRQVFDVKKDCEFEYSIDNHRMKLRTDTKKIKIKTANKSGEVFIKYILKQNNEIFTENILTINYIFLRSERNNGKKYDSKN